MTDATSQTPSTESTQGPIADPPPGDVRPRGRVAAAIRAWGEAEGRARALIERDEALAERDRARATAVRLEQELAEMTEAASVAIGMVVASQTRETEFQDNATELIAKAKEALP